MALHTALYFGAAILMEGESAGTAMDGWDRSGLAFLRRG